MSVVMSFQHSENVKVNQVAPACCYSVRIPEFLVRKAFCEIRSTDPTLINIG